MSEENTKQEFLEHIKDKGKVICANISKNRYSDDNYPVCILKENYNEKEFEEFLKSLEFNYDDGYGGQELFGLILFKDSYSDRGEYDGSEWWSNHKMKTVKDVLDYKHE